MIEALKKCNRVNWPLVSLLPSSSHDSWTAAYEVGGKLQQFIEKQFGAVQPVRDEVISSYYDGQSLIFETKSGKIIKR